ncbi:MAG: hypothetical protein AAF449_24475 [Myxococcota bacterium]
MKTGAGRITLLGLGLMVLTVAGLAGLFVDHHFEVVMDDRLKGPSFIHPLGTDWLGRDLLARLVAGTRGFFLPGLVATVVCSVLGVGLGALVGYRPPTDALRLPSARRRAFEWMQKLIGVVLALPGALPRMVVLVLLCAAFGFDAYLLAAGAALVYAGELGEDVRHRVRRCCQEEYVEAAIAAGRPGWWVLGYHILWLHVRSLVARHLFQLWAFVILMETSLSFMPGAFGIQEPESSWGNMLEGTRDAAMAGHYWASAVVTVAIVSTIVVLAWAGDRFGREDGPGGSL